MEENRPTLDEYYLDIALAVSKRSTCLKKHYGAVIVQPTTGIIATGYNGNPCGEPHCTVCTKQTTEKSFSAYLDCKSVHAEMNALLNARKDEMISSTLYLAGWKADTGTEFTEAAPCEICLRLIKNAGINKVVTRKGLLYQRNEKGILEKVENEEVI